MVVYQPKHVLAFVGTQTCKNARYNIPLQENNEIETNFLETKIISYNSN